MNKMPVERELTKLEKLAKNLVDIGIVVRGVKPPRFLRSYGKASTIVNDEVDIVDLDDIGKHLYERILFMGRVVCEKSV